MDFIKKLIKVVKKLIKVVKKVYLLQATVLVFSSNVLRNKDNSNIDVCYNNKMKEHHGLKFKPTGRRRRFGTKGTPEKTVRKTKDVRKIQELLSEHH